MMRIPILTMALLSAAPAFAQAMPPAAIPTADVDPARLAVATRIIDTMLPDGTYRKIMTPVFDAMTGQMMDSMMSVPVRGLARSMGFDDTRINQLGPGSLKDVMAVLDPAFQERTNITMKIMMGGMVDVLSDMEPELRTVFARVYARNFDLKQLNDIEAFFATPTGRVYATRAMTVAGDPEVLGQSKAMMPKMLEQFPVLMKKADAATAHLPKRRNPEDLSAAEKKRVAELLGIDPAKVK